MAFVNGIWDDFINWLQSLFQPTTYPTEEEEITAPEWVKEWVRTYEPSPEQIAEQKAKEYGVDPSLVKAVIQVESNWNPKAVSWVGAIGLMQILPQTAEWLGISPNLLYSVEHNIEAGVKYLKYLIDKYKGNIWDAVSAYNWGYAAKKRGRYVNQGYVNRVKQVYESIT